MIEFSKLEVGSWFCIDNSGAVYVRMQSIITSIVKVQTEYNAVNIETGQPQAFNKDQKAARVRASVQH